VSRFDAVDQLALRGRKDDGAKIDPVLRLGAHCVLGLLSSVQEATAQGFACQKANPGFMPLRVKALCGMSIPDDSL
jgi:hypothetical protein